MAWSASDLARGNLASGYEQKSLSLTMHRSHYLARVLACCLCALFIACWSLFRLIEYSRSFAALGCL